MKIKYHILEVHFRQQLDAAKADITLFENLLKDWKIADREAFEKEIPYYGQINCSIERLENAIKNLQNDLTENTLMINRDLMERFKNLGANAKKNSDYKSDRLAARALVRKSGVK